MRITWASSDRSEPRGSSRSRVSSVTGGSWLPSESRSGAPIGGPARTEAAMAVCQSSWSTSPTAVGRSEVPVAGYRAPATPAASAAASLPPTRIVFRVALEGKPSFSAASSSSASTPSCGGREVSSSPSEQPPRKASSASAGTRRRIAAQISRACRPRRHLRPLRSRPHPLRAREKACTIDWSVNVAGRAGNLVDFRLSDEQLEYQAHCRRFAREVMRPVAAEHDRDESVPWEAIKAAREWGLHGLETIQLMGEDPDGILSCIYAEEMHWGCAGIALAIQGGSLAAAGIASSGTPEQIGRWVPECFGMGDEIKLGAYAVTEPSAGSDVRSLRTTAKQDGDEWVLNGTKVFITNGGIADVTVVVATVDPHLGHRGQASFVVPKGTPGLSQGKKESKLGIAQAAYEWTLEYLSDKEEDGQPLLQQQRIQQTLADVATEIEAARLLVWRAAWMGRNGIPLTGGGGPL